MPRLTVCSLSAGHEMVAAQQGDPHQQQLAGGPEPQDLNPDGSEKKKRRQHTRWKEEEVMRLLEGVERLGVGHWRQMCVTVTKLTSRWLNPGNIVARLSGGRGAPGRRPLAPDVRGHETPLTGWSNPKNMSKLCGCWRAWSALTSATGARCAQSLSAKHCTFKTKGGSCGCWRAQTPWH